MFNEAVTTIKGMRLNTKIQAGQCLMNFTKIKLGKGLHGEDELLEGLEALFEIQQEVSISRVEIMSENTVKISTVISNEGMEEGFYISEIGVFAEDPDEGEILYSVAVGTEGKMDYHPSYAEMSNYSLSLDMYIAVSNVEKISIDTVPGAAASAEELRELEKKVEALENVEFEDYTGEDSTPPDARTAISKLISGIAHNKFGEYVKAALMGLVTIGEMRGLLVNHGLCTEPGKFFLDAAYGKYLTDQITQLNSDFSTTKVITMTSNPDWIKSDAGKVLCFKIADRYIFQFTEVIFLKDGHVDFADTVLWTLGENTSSGHVFVLRPISDKTDNYFHTVRLYCYNDKIYGHYSNIYKDIEYFGLLVI